MKQNYDWGENQTDANCSTVNQPEWDCPVISWFDKQSLLKRAINMSDVLVNVVWLKIPWRRTKRKKENADSIWKLPRIGRLPLNSGCWQFGITPEQFPFVPTAKHFCIQCKRYTIQRWCIYYWILAIFAAYEGFLIFYQEWVYTPIFEREMLLC